MQSARSAAFVCGPGLQFFLVLHPLVGTSLHLRGCILVIMLARRRRERSVAGTFTYIYDCEEPLPIQGSCATHRARAAGAQRPTEMLPALQGLLLEEPDLSGPVRENIEKFVASRLLSSHPISVSHWDRK